MITIADPTRTIDKEEIERLNFPEQEVLFNKDEIEERRSQAEKAMRLGNMFHTRVKIVFEDSKGMKMVETTIWGVSDRNLVLKKAILLPLHRVHKLVM